jgi:hypothetical protein
MAKAFYHHGLTIEFDAQIPRLTVDGQEIAISGMSDRSTDTLIEHAKSFVDTNRDFTKRDSIRDEHVESFEMEPIAGTSGACRIQVFGLFSMVRN